MILLIQVKPARLVTIIGAALCAGLVILGTASVRSSLAQVFPPRTILPGRSAGWTRLGEPKSIVLRQFGPPDHAESAMQDEWDTWRTRVVAAKSQHELDILFQLDPTGLKDTAWQVRITSPWFQTVSDIHVGSSLRLVKRRFPHAVLLNRPLISMKNDHVTVYDDVHGGIAFEFQGSPQTQPTSRCTAIVVHYRGQPVDQVYLPWYQSP